MNPIEVSYKERNFKYGVEFSIPYGTLVRVTVNDTLQYMGRVVGKATTGLTQSHIVQCTDGKLPNDEYLYDTFVAPLAIITMFEDA